MKFVFRSMFFLCCLGNVLSPGFAEQPRLLGGFVDLNRPEYSDVADAVAMFQRGRATVSLELLRTAVKSHPELPPAEVMYAHVCFATGQAEAGLKVLQAAAISNENDPEPWTMLGDIARRSERLAEADVLFEKALQQTQALTDNPVRRNFLMANALAGLALVDERRALWDRAEPHLRDWLKIQPDNADAMRRLAGVYFNQKKMAEARAVLEDLRSRHSGSPLPEVVMGLLYQKSDQSSMAEQMMREALQRGSDDVVTRLAVADWAATCGRTGMAQENAAHVLQQEPDSIAATMIKARVLRFEGRHEDAQELLQDVVSHSPASFAASNQLALTLLAREDADLHRKALEYARVNLDRYKDLRTQAGRNAASTFAWCLHRLNQNDAAKKVMQQVITHGEVSPQTGYFAALIYRSAGETNVARQLLEKSLSSYIAFPEQQSAQQLLESLQDSEPGTSAGNRETVR